MQLQVSRCAWSDHKTVCREQQEQDSEELDREEQEEADLQKAIQVGCHTAT